MAPQKYEKKKPNLQYAPNQPQSWSSELPYEASLHAVRRCSSDYEAPSVGFEIVVAAAVETPKRNKKVRAVKGESSVILSKESDQKFSDLSKKASNAFANTDDADVEMAEPCEDADSSDESTFHITLRLPCKRARGKRQKLRKGKVVGDQDGTLSERLKGKKKRK